MVESGYGRAVAVVALFGVVACGSGDPETGPPSPTYGAIPNLRGTQVMVFPVQLVGDESRRAEIDGEIRFAVEEAGIDWILPAELDDIIARSPNLNVNLRDLPVSQFLAREVTRVGDPLFGALRRLNAMTDARVAVIPVWAGPVDAADAEAAAPGMGQGGWGISAALIDAARGFVLWYGSVEAGVAEAGAPPPVAQAALTLVERLAPAR